MTISVSVRETAASAIQWDFGASSQAPLPLPSTAHKRSIADVARSSWISDSDVEICRSGVIGQVSRLTRRGLEPTAGYLTYIPVDIERGAFPPTTANFTPEMRERRFPPPSDTIDFTALAGPNLRDALHDLNEVKNEAREDKFTVPSDVAVGNAQRLLLAMYQILARRFEVYPMPDGEVAIDVPGGPGRSVLLLCGSDGGALCSVNMNGVHRYARYSNSSARRLPDGFVREALAELERSDDATA